MAAPSWWPTLTVSLQLGYGIEDSWSDAFTDVTDAVRSVSMRTGRDDEFGDAQAGTCTIVLDNQDGTYDPSVNTDLRPNVRVLVTVAVDDVIGTTSYTLFAGFVDAITQTWDSAWGETVTIECVDVLALLALLPFSATRTSEVISVRWGAITTDLVPAYVDVVDDYGGTVREMPSQTYTDANMLDALKEVALAEDGVIVASGTTLRLYGQDTWGSFAPALTLTDAPSGGAEMEYESVDIDVSNTYVYNDVTVTDDAAHSSRTINGSAVARHGVRRYELTIPVDDSAETRRRADRIAYGYGDPRVRVKSVTVRPVPSQAQQADGGAWHELLNSPRGATVIVEGARPGGAFSQWCVVEGVAHDISQNGEWTVTLSTSPVLASAGALYETEPFHYEDARYWG